MRRVPSDRGFTLLEMLVVLAIVALVSAVILPRLSRQSGDATLQTQVREVAARLRLARLEAMENGTVTTASIDLKDKSVLVSGKQIVFAPATVITVRTARNLIVSGKASIDFVPLGGSTGGSITFKQAEREFSVDISWLSGAVTLRPGTGS
ncbi:N/A [soil metagenome]